LPPNLLLYSPQAISHALRQPYLNRPRVRPQAHPVRYQPHANSQMQKLSSRVSP